MSSTVSISSCTQIASSTNEFSVGFSFYISFSRTLGLMFYDIKFKGERILYELSMQEATAQYGGNQPKAANTVYHDTYYQLGTEMGTLLEGFDCPWGSTFWNITYPSYNTTRTNRNAICLFEADMNFPLSRHRTSSSNNYSFSNFGTVKGAQFIVRAVATVGNYDYMFDYSFHMDGSIEVVVRASGYLQSSFYYPAQGKFGKQGLPPNTRLSYPLIVSSSGRPTYSTSYPRLSTRPHNNLQSRL